MIGFLINILKIIFLLGFLVFIHEGGHFIVAKLCKIKVNNFSIGFGPEILKKQGKETKYSLRLIPLGGFVSMEGEEEPSENEGSFSKASVWKRILIVLAGGIVNILFGIIVYYFLVAHIVGFKNALSNTVNFLASIFDNLKQLFSGGIDKDQLMGIVGISKVVVKTTGIENYLYILSLISLSLGITNLLPFPPLDGGKVVILLIEAIRRKPLSEKLEISLQMIGFYALIGLSILVMYNDINRII